jgi:hypothetical protein
VWSDDDQMAALEWAADESFRCSGCGLDMRETVGPEHEDKWNAELSDHCDGCRAKERARSMIADEHPDPNAGARLRYWRDKEIDNGRVDDPSADGEQARTVGP